MTKALPSHSSPPQTSIAFRSSEARGKQRALRLVVLMIGAATMLAGLLSGLAHIGVPLPGANLGFVEFHGALMISGFLGTLISLERSVAFGRGWVYVAPLSSAGGAAALLAGASWLAMPAFLVAGGCLTAAAVLIFLRHRALFTFVLAIAAASWGIGTLTWIVGRPFADTVGWWLTFLILTIAAERLELSRLINPPPTSQAMFVVIVILIVAGSTLGELNSVVAPLTGLGLFACAVWLAHFDVANRTIRQSGLARFTATCVMLGHLWLAAGGLLLLLFPPAAWTFGYDAAIHAVAIGFVLSMIFGHAPIILPAITGFRVTFTLFAYLPLGLLHLSLILRITADLAEWIHVRAPSGIRTAVALAGYAAVLLLAARLQKGSPASRGAQGRA
jgi:hypothetical protein